MTDQPDSPAAALAAHQAAVREIEMLASTWRGYIATHEAGDQLRRHAGYVSGLSVCAGQVETALARLREATAPPVDTRTFAERMTAWEAQDNAPIRCYDCTACERDRSAWCNDPAGFCHPGPCQPSADDWGQPVA